MSGVAGNDKVQSRSDFKIILDEYTKLVKGFPGFEGVETSGSYNSNMKKTTFGDIDLILHIDGSKYGNDKKKVKNALIKFLLSFDDDIITPFLSAKYAGRRYYNSGEIITISFNPSSHKIGAAQIDNIVALDEKEAKFKKDFLDMPAPKQGLILGAIKVALQEFDKNKIFKAIKFKPEPLNDNQTYEFNLSSKEIQLRKITYREGTFKETKREIVWNSTNWDYLQKILYKLDLGLSFEDLITQVKKIFKSRRSKSRLAGVFKSMVSIKSGEMPGTPGAAKGADKQKALDLVSKLMSEDSTKFNDLYESILTRSTRRH